MRIVRIAALAALCSVALDWQPAGALARDRTRPPASAGAERFAVADSAGRAAGETAPKRRRAVLLAAGDIGNCHNDGAKQTAALLDRLSGTVVPLGDLAYPYGSRKNFAKCYQPTWGRHRWRTRPVIGNHEYHRRKAKGYFTYWGHAAGRRGRGWYTYKAGSWRVVVLNTNCHTRVRCDAESRQTRWVRAVLRDSRRRGERCTVAVGHHPFFSSSRVHSKQRALRPLMSALYKGGVDIVLTAHNHHYERFAPQTHRGERTRKGFRQFVVGTGGHGHYPFGRPHPHSEVRHTGTYGVLKLDLRPGRYSWRFIPVKGKTFTDRGTGRCH